MSFFSSLARSEEGCTLSEDLNGEEDALLVQLRPHWQHQLYTLIICAGESRPQSVAATQNDWMRLWKVTPGMTYPDSTEM